MGIRPEDMQAAVDYLAIDDPAPIAAAEYELAKAKSEKDRIFAQVFVEVEGSVRERECKVELNWEYQKARELENLAIKEVANQKSKQLWAKTITELYRTVSANTRIAERIR